MLGSLAPNLSGVRYSVVSNNPLRPTTNRDREGGAASSVVPSSVKAAWGQMKAKLRTSASTSRSTSVALGLLSASALQGRTSSSSSTDLINGDRHDLPAPRQSPTAVETMEDPKLVYICQLGVSLAVARLALQQTGDDGINAALDWIYDERNAKDVQAAEAGRRANKVTRSSSLVSREEYYGSRSDSAAHWAPLRTLTPQVLRPPPLVNPEDYLDSLSDSTGHWGSMLAMTPQGLSPHRASLDGQRPRVSSDGRGLGMGLGRRYSRRVSRSSSGGADGRRCSRGSPATGAAASSDHGSSSSPARHRSDTRRGSRGGGRDAGPADDQVLYSARGSAYKVPLGAALRMDGNQTSQSLVLSESVISSRGRGDEDDEAVVEEGEEEEEEEEAKAETEVEADEEGRCEQQEELQKPVAESGDAAEELEMLPLPPDSDSWDWPLSRNEKKTRIQLIEQQLHTMDRRTLAKQLVDAHSKLRDQPQDECEDPGTR